MRIITACSWRHWITKNIEFMTSTNTFCGLQQNNCQELQEQLPSIEVKVRVFSYGQNCHVYGKFMVESSCKYGHGLSGKTQFYAHVIISPKYYCLEWFLFWSIGKRCLFVLLYWYLTWYPDDSWSKVCNEYRETV